LGAKINCELFKSQKTNHINNRGLAFNSYSYYYYTEKRNIENCYIAGNNGTSPETVETDVTGGDQFITNFITTETIGVELINSPNYNCGSAWDGFISFH
jgi:hypothetical protein